MFLERYIFVAKNSPSPKKKANNPLDLGSCGYVPSFVPDHTPRKNFKVQLAHIQISVYVYDGFERQIIHYYDNSPFKKRYASFVPTL